MKARRFIPERLEVEIPGELLAADPQTSAERWLRTQ